MMIVRAGCRRARKAIGNTTHRGAGQDYIPRLSRSRTRLLISRRRTTRWRGGKKKERALREIFYGPKVKEISRAEMVVTIFEAGYLGRFKD